MSIHSPLVWEQNWSHSLLGQADSPKFCVQVCTCTTCVYLVFAHFIRDMNSWDEYLQILLNDGTGLVVCLRTCYAYKEINR